MKLSEEQLQSILEVLARKKQFNPDYIKILRDDLKSARVGNSVIEAKNINDFGSFLQTVESP